ncbi:WD40 repeat-like protein [Coniophora puteana RWD-64-598 SS2]|uniref:non-specific serine/threonine protein kinase n=1 Tax=Coniophora puteana (strain RWD-64-598) TaxID=741705 RepID=A0A5M3MLF1_CONPW|nr:WD40 repeat-like protein [Coniophora puteana RWD-64-598 SS2]EIW79923.1 WD40 repeat-like protein [Coniophora puteana RWD-64-598 SS2]
MGNVQSGSALTRTTGALDSFVAELGPDVVYDKSLGQARFLKTVKCRHRNGALVVKIFIKQDPGISLRNYQRRLKIERESLLDIPNVYNYQTFVETDKAGYIIRQWIGSNLYDRISTRPFLSLVEKKWIAFQLLTALRDARNRRISHGDIKSTNILVTSWNWIYLAEFAAPYKPTYLPLDDPADFSFFFDTSGRRTCYIAPERFYTATSNPEVSARKDKLGEEDGEGKRDGKVTEAMDCFSAGCVLAELFLEGPLFSLSQLFKYREGEYSVEGHLNGIEDAGIRNMIKQMISLDPIARPNFESLLHTSRGTIFPESFYSFLHSYISSINDLPFNAFSPLSSSGSAAGSALATPTISTPNPSSIQQPPSAPLKSAGASAAKDALADGAPNVLPSDSDHRIERIWEDFEGVEPYLIPDDEGTEGPPRELEKGDGSNVNVKIDYTTSPISSKPLQDIFPVELHIPNREPRLGGPSAASEDGPALVILSLVSANIRNCALPSSRLRALDVFLALARHLTDEAKLDRMVPYVVDLLHDDAAVVRVAALRTLVQVLMLVKVITPSNTSVFPEYVLPNVRYLAADPEVSVRAAYAQCIVQLADTALRYLEVGQALKAYGRVPGASTSPGPSVHPAVSYDAALADLQASVQEQLAALLMDGSSIVKRAVLHNVGALCLFLGRQRTNDVLLSHMITYLNDRDWALRCAFFESIVDVAACAGGRSLDEYILPLMVQALLCELGLFQKMRIWELMSATLGFFYHPNVWIRQGHLGFYVGAAAFIASAAKHLPTSDVWCILYPSLRHLLRCDVKVIDEQSLLGAMKPPLSRAVFDGAVQWAMKADKTAFWRGHRRPPSKVESPRESIVSMRKAGSVSSVGRNKTEEDEAHLNRLQNLGMAPADEGKLFALRDYILKLANNTASFAARSRTEAEKDATLKTTGDVEMQKLGVQPQTVFLRAAARAGSSTSGIADLASRASSLDRGSVVGAVVGAGGAPFEDLRRRLATINGSQASVALSSPGGGARERAAGLGLGLSLLPPPQPSSSAGSSPAPAPPAVLSPARPGSPTESIVSATNSLVVRTGHQHRLHVGSTDGQKAAPAVGASHASAIGVLEASSRMRAGEDGMSSGRTSPVSTAGTIGSSGGLRPRVPSLLPISTYDGHDPGISTVLEHLYLDNSHARELQHDFGPRVHEGPIRRRNAARQRAAALSQDAGSDSSNNAHPGSTRRPAADATLIAHLSSHTAAITGLAVSPDHVFFVSCSDDGTVKVWDTARLERSVTAKPRATYAGHGQARVKAVCVVEGTHCFVSAGEDGGVHVVRVFVGGGGGYTVPKYGKLQLVREHRVEGAAEGEWVSAMGHWNSDTSSNLIYTTTHARIVTLDLRSMRVLQTLQNPRHLGAITCMCVDVRKRAWVLVGTASGALALWDRRFGMLLRTWMVGRSAGAGAKGRQSRVHGIAVHPTKGRGRWVVVGVETARDGGANGSGGGNGGGAATMIEVWDIEAAVLVESFVTRTAAVSPATTTTTASNEGMGTAEMSPAAAIAALVNARYPGGAAYSSGLSASPGSRGGYGNGNTHEDMMGASLPAPSVDVRAMVVGADFGGYGYGVHHRSELVDLGEDMVASSLLSRSAGRGFLISGGEDRRIRLWDLAKVERTCVLVGPDAEHEKPAYSSVRAKDKDKDKESGGGGGKAVSYVETWLPTATTAGQMNRPAQRMSLITHSQQSLVRAHLDVVTALACLESPFRGGIVSGDRAGVVKVWRVGIAE